MKQTSYLNKLQSRSKKMITLVFSLLVCVASCLCVNIIQQYAFAGPQIILPVQPWEPSSGPSLSSIPYSNGVYKISTRAHMDTLSEYVRSGAEHDTNNCTGKTFVLQNNLNLGSTNFIPIGTFVSGKTDANYFAGTFDGNGYTITVRISSDSTYATRDLGLFGYLHWGAVIKNLKVSGSITQTSSSYSVGGIAGSVYNEVKIENCTNYATITASAQNNSIGGIVGFSSVNTNIVISKCINSGTISNNSTGTACAGGICGNAEQINSITFCENLASISSGTTSTDSAYAGGIVGKLSSGSISYCANTIPYINQSIRATAKENSETKVSLTTSDYYSEENEPYVGKVANLAYREQVEVIRYYTNAYAGGLAGLSNGAISNSYSVSGYVLGGKEYYRITMKVLFAGRYFSATTGFTNSFKQFGNETVYVLTVDNLMPQQAICAAGNGTFTQVYNYNSAYYENTGSISTKYRGGSTGDTTYTIMGMGDWPKGDGKKTPDSAISFGAFSAEQSNSISGEPLTSVIQASAYGWKISMGLTINVNIENNKLTISESTDPTAYSRGYFNKSYTADISSYDFCTKASVSSGLPTGLSQDVWAISSYINNGFPHFKYKYWEDEF
ncbi:MAG: hypothetical protein E7378_01880 [Clostridiales bacterium]|nr:hypothetical protein [Clostridiales bacterium]